MVEPYELSPELWTAQSYGLPSELNVKAEYDFGKYIKTIGNGHQLQYFNKLN